MQLQCENGNSRIVLRDEERSVRVRWPRRVLYDTVTDGPNYLSDGHRDVSLYFLAFCIIIFFWPSIFVFILINLPVLDDN